MPGQCQEQCQGNAKSRSRTEAGPGARPKCEFATLKEYCDDFNEIFKTTKHKKLVNGLKQNVNVKKLKLSKDQFQCDCSVDYCSLKESMTEPVVKTQLKVI